MATSADSNARNGTRSSGLDTADADATEASPEAIETGEAVEAADVAEAGEATDVVDDRIGLTDPDVSTDASDSAAVPARLDVTPGFLAELSVAMRSVVGRERDRIQALIDEDKERHVTQAREQSASEAEAFRRVADEDVAAIEAWADEETDRIRAEAATRVADRKADLEAYLVQHEAVLQGELDGIDVAVATYSASLVGFLDDLDTTNDPEEIAHRAHEIPRAPDLEMVRSLARAEALTRLAEQAMAEEAANAPEVVEAEAGTADALAGDDVIAEAAPEATADVAEPAAAADDQLLAVADVEGAVVGMDVVSAEGEADFAAAMESVEIDATTDHLSGGNGAAGWLSEPDRPAEPVAAVASDYLAGDSDTDFGLGSMVDEPPITTDTPVATMDAVGSDAESATTPAASSEPAFGHTNAAVRLIRSVAPWTAPSHGDNADERRD